MIPDSREKLVAVNVAESDDRDAYDMRMRERLRDVGLPVSRQVRNLIEYMHDADAVLNAQAIY